MLLILQCYNPAGVAQLTLRSGQRGRVGSSEWVELSVSESHLEPEHFVVECRYPPKLICSPDCQVEQQGQLLTELELQPGASFSAGGCQFEVNVSVGWDSLHSHHPSQVATASKGLPGDRVPVDRVPVDRVPAEQWGTWWTTVEWEAIDCSAHQAQSLQQHASLRTAVQQLVERKEWTLALRLIAHLLPHPQCVGWAAQAITGVEPESTTTSPLSDTGGLPASRVHAWLKQPTEALRQKVPVARVPLTAEEWLAQAIVWTGGSLAPADTPEVPPPKSLCGIACATALQLHHAREQAPYPLKHTIDTGVALLESLSPVFASVGLVASLES